MKVLITGGCGFLGSNLAASYLEEETEVVIADALFRRGSEQNLEWLRGKGRGSQLLFQQIDLADEAGMEEFFHRHAPFDYICHLGGQVAMTTSLSDPRRDLLTNVQGSFNVLESARRHSPGSVISYSSTNKVYGDLGDLRYREEATRYSVPDFPEGFDESTPLDFASPYGCSKGAADQYIRDWHRNFGLKTVVFRHSSIYGGRQYATFDQGWIGWFCQKALEQQAAFARGAEPEPFTIQGSGKQVRDVLHADDLIRLYRAAYTNASRAAGQIFNIGGGMANSLSLLELFAFLEKTLGLEKPLHFTKLARRQSDQDFFVADIRKAHDYLGWKPLITTEHGISMMIEWCRGQLGQP
jgi:CDP-paratose 2-epimerase